MSLLSLDGGLGWESFQFSPTALFNSICVALGRSSVPGRVPGFQEQELSAELSTAIFNINARLFSEKLQLRNNLARDNYK